MTHSEMAAKAARLAAPVFKAQAWTYGGGVGTKERVPTENELAETVAMLIRSVTEQPDVHMSRSGRFRVTQDDCEGTGSELRVSLELAADYD